MKNIEIEDIAEYRIPQKLLYSPDGKVLVFELESSDKEKNEYHTDLWMYRNNQLSQLTATLDAHLLCFMDNSHVLFLRKKKDQKQGISSLFCIDINGGEALSVMDVPFVMNGMKKVRDDVYACPGTIDVNEPDLYCRDDKTREEYFKVQKDNEDYQVMDEVPFWFNGLHYINKTRTALFLLHLKEKKVQRVTSPEFDLNTLEVHDGKVYFTGTAWKNTKPQTDQMYVCDAEGKIKVLYGQNDYSITKIFFLKKQMYVLATDMKEYGCNETAAFHACMDGKLVFLKKPEVSLYNSVIGDTLDLSSAGIVVNDHYMTLATVDDHTELFSFDGKLNHEVLWKKQGSIGGFAFGEKLALIYQDWRQPAEVYVCDTDGSHPKRITHFNDEAVRDCYVAKPLKISYASAGERLHGWVLLPKDFDETKKYPAVLDVHGGPRAVYGETFFHEMQVWASKGFFVFFTNIRGSDGRGDAFADIRDQYGYVDYQNLMDFTDAVLKKYPQIDETKVCETGGSYGGFMTNWIITHTDRFCCAASQRSISNWISFSLISDIGPVFGPDQCGASSPFDTEKLWEHSPLKYVQNAKTPTLFIHSEQDHRCPLEQGIQMMQALNVQGVETRMCMFKGENHELSRSGKPLHRIRRLNEITQWFEKHTR